MKRFPSQSFSGLHPVDQQGEAAAGLRLFIDGGELGLQRLLAEGQFIHIRLPKEQREIRRREVFECRPPPGLASPGRRIDNA